METLLNALPWIVGGLILILLLAALRRPLEWLVRLAARTGVGLAALWASRWIKRLFETFLEFQKVQQPVENTFSTGWGGRCGTRPSFAVRPAVGAFLQGGGRFIQRLFTHL